jgi:hypothetical protein
MRSPRCAAVFAPGHQESPNIRSPLLSIGLPASCRPRLSGNDRQLEDSLTQESPNIRSPLLSIGLPASCRPRLSGNDRQLEDSLTQR